jgi:4-phytase / acid phosphatase
MARICRLRGKGRGGALTWAVLVSWLCLAGQIRIANAEEPAANVEAPRPSVFTVIVTRHGVRSPTKFLGGEYTWPRWDPVRDAFLTKHGYQLMTLMGAFYGEPVLGAPVDCGKVFVYADKDQRTYLTAQALLAGLCRPGTIGPIYHEPDVTAADPIFNGAKWVGKRINFSDSSNAIKAVAGDPPSKIVTSHAEDFAIFQRLLETRCPSRNCAPIERGDSAIQPTKEGLAELGGPLNTASYSEDLFLEYAQCRAIAQIAPGNDEDTLKVYLNAGLRLHVLAYQVNARNAYNPLVRGGTLLGHIVGMLDMKAARPNVLNVVTPAEVKDKALVILSGHDTQLGALGGILGAHWSPGGGVAPDDMPPGSALIIDLLKTPTGYGVQLRFASMTVDQFRNNGRISKDSIRLMPVTGSLCNSAQCVVPLEQFEGLALKLQAKQLVDRDWRLSNAGLQFPTLNDPGDDPKNPNPDWKDAECKP